MRAPICVAARQSSGSRSACLQARSAPPSILRIRPGPFSWINLGSSPWLFLRKLDRACGASELLVLLALVFIEHPSAGSGLSLKLLKLTVNVPESRGNALPSSFHLRDRREVLGRWATRRKWSAGRSLRGSVFPSSRDSLGRLSDHSNISGPTVTLPVLEIRSLGLGEER